MDLTNECGYLNIAKSQRENEIKDGLGTAGTMGFETMGCYDCSGYNKKCGSYFSPLEQYLKGYNIRTKTDKLIVIESKKTQNTGDKKNG